MHQKSEQTTETEMISIQPIQSIEQKLEALNRKDSGGVWHIKTDNLLRTLISLFEAVRESEKDENYQRLFSAAYLPYHYYYDILNSKYSTRYQPVLDALAGFDRHHPPYNLQWNTPTIQRYYRTQLAFHLSMTEKFPCSDAVSACYHQLLGDDYYFGITNPQNETLGMQHWEIARTHGDVSENLAFQRLIQYYKRENPQEQKAVRAFYAALNKYKVSIDIADAVIAFTELPIKLRKSALKCKAHLLSAPDYMAQVTAFTDSPQWKEAKMTKKDHTDFIFNVISKDNINMIDYTLLQERDQWKNMTLTEFKERYQTKNNARDNWERLSPHLDSIERFPSWYLFQSLLDEPSNCHLISQLDRAKFKRVFTSGTISRVAQNYFALWQKNQLKIWCKKLVSYNNYHTFLPALTAAYAFFLNARRKEVREDKSLFGRWGSFNTGRPQRKYRHDTAEISALEWLFLSKIVLQRHSTCCFSKDFSSAYIYAVLSEADINNDFIRIATNFEQNGDYAVKQYVAYMRALMFNEDFKPAQTPTPEIQKAFQAGFAVKHNALKEKVFVRLEQNTSFQKQFAKVTAQMFSSFPRPQTTASSTIDGTELTERPPAILSSSRMN